MTPIQRKTSGTKKYNCVGDDVTAMSKAPVFMGLKFLFLFANEKQSIDIYFKLYNSLFRENKKNFVYSIDTLTY